MWYLRVKGKENKIDEWINNNINKICVRFIEGYCLFVIRFEINEEFIYYLSSSMVISRIFFYIFCCYLIDIFFFV